jgi:hypothetical protein
MSPRRWMLSTTLAETFRNNPPNRLRRLAGYWPDGFSRTNQLTGKSCSELGFYWWSRLVSNQRPSACEADALPLSYETWETHRSVIDGTSEINTDGRAAENPDGATWLRMRRWSHRHDAASWPHPPQPRSEAALRLRRPGLHLRGVLPLDAAGDDRRFGTRRPPAGLTGTEAPRTAEPRVVTELVGFRSPSSNVGCYLDVDYVRCNAAARSRASRAGTPRPGTALRSPARPISCSDPPRGIARTGFVRPRTGRLLLPFATGDDLARGMRM